MFLLKLHNINMMDSTWWMKSDQHKHCFCLNSTWCWSLSLSAWIVHEHIVAYTVVHVTCIFHSPKFQLDCLQTLQFKYKGWRESPQPLRRLKMLPPAGVKLTTSRRQHSKPACSDQAGRQPSLKLYSLWCTRMQRGNICAQSKNHNNKQ